ncbi:MAG: hypothetical protein KC656_10020 [Myxococcales bacterium]|nr:hypothetical protein [Myxococcales bacterium]MCB9668792.1 hypothetical protein [Alphaproteobacteria bacterium]MCB9691415.1 hypothetical protein [Alphaproteobacteria bacterium]
MLERIWTITSDIEVPLRVIARDWRTALCLGLQLLELEDAVARLKLVAFGEGVSAEDPATGVHLWVSALEPA